MKRPVFFPPVSYKTNVQHTGAVLALSKCRPLFHELFLIAVHSHGHGASDRRTSLWCRERAAIMPHPVARLVSVGE